MDVISLLKLLKDLLPPDVYANIARHILTLMESMDPVKYEFLAEELLKWTRQHYPQYEKLIRLILDRVKPGAPTPPTPPAPTPPAPPTPPGPSGIPWKGIVRGGIYAALAYLLIAAILDSTVDLTHTSAGTGPCATNVTPVPLSTSASSYGPKAALKKAKEKIQMLCTNSGINCSGGTCPSCAADAAIQTVDVKTRIFWATVDITARCQCWCK